MDKNKSLLDAWAQAAVASMLERVARLVALAYIARAFGASEDEEDGE